MFRFPLPLSLALWLAAAAQSFASGLQQWTERPSGLTNDLHAVAYGNGQFVAVGQGGVIVVSSDGVSWNSAGSPTAASLYGVGYGAGKFVAVGDLGTIVTSSNGLDWVRRDSGVVAELFGVVYGGGRFVGVGRLDTGTGYEGVITTADDGVNWISRDSGVRDPLFAIAYGAGVHIAVGHLSALASTDSINWQRVQVPNYGPVYGIVYGNSRFVTAESDVYTPTFPFSVSMDGQSWQNTSAQTDGAARSVTFGGGVFAAVGGLNLFFGNPTNQVAISADGENWATYSIGLIPELRGIAYGADTFVAVGLGGTIVQSGVTIQPTLAIRRQAGEAAVLITVSGDPGIYRLQTSTNLAAGDWSDWMMITNPVPSVTLLDNTTMNLQQRYYRLVEP